MVADASILPRVTTANNIGLPIFLNADHTYSVAKAQEAVEAVKSIKWLFNREGS